MKSASDGADTVTSQAQTNAYFLAFIALGLTAAVLGPTLPGLADQTGSQIGQIGILFTAQALGNMVSSLVSGRLFDRVPGHPLIAIQTVVIALMLALTPFVDQLVWLAAIMFIIGVGMGTLDVGCNTLLVWLWRHSVAPRLNALHFFFGVGALIAPIVAAQVIARTGDIDATYWLLALLLVPLPFVFFRLPSPAHHHAANRLAATPPPLIPLLLLIAIFFFYVGAEMGFGGWIYTYAVETNLATAAAAGYLTALFWGALTLGRLLTIPIASRIRPRHLLIVDIAGMFVSLGLLVMSDSASLMVWIAAFGMGLAAANVFPTLVSMAEHNMPITGSTTRWFLVGASLGSIVIPYLIGQLFERVGPNMMVVCIGLCVVAMALFLGLFLWSVSPRRRAVPVS